jgi:P-type Cu+ transporter
VTSGSTYICPMRPSVRQSSPGKCPKCGMALVPESARFALLRTSHPVHLVVMRADHVGGYIHGDDD